MMSFVARDRGSGYNIAYWIHSLLNWNTIIAQAGKIEHPYKYINKIRTRTINGRIRKKRRCCLKIVFIKTSSDQTEYAVGSVMGEGEQ